MNLNLLIKSAFLIGYLVFITKLQSGLSFNVLAQDTITLENQNLNLSKQEQTDLKQGKVILQGKKGDYFGQVLAIGNIDNAWSVLTDYNNFASFLPNVSSSKIIIDQGNRQVFEQTTIVDLWFFTEEFTIQIEANQTKPQKIDFQLFKGDLKHLSGTWQIQEVNSNQIMVIHTVEVEPESNTEKAFFYGIYENSLENTLKAIAQEITKRSQI